MAEVANVTFAAENGSQIHGVVQNGSSTGEVKSDSCVLSSVMEKMDNRIENQENLVEGSVSCASQEGELFNEREPVQNGEVEETGECHVQGTETANVHQHLPGNCIEMKSSELGKETISSCHSSNSEKETAQISNTREDKQLCGTNVNFILDTGKCPADLQLSNNYTASVGAKNLFPCATQGTLQGSCSSSEMCTTSTVNSIKGLPNYSPAENKSEIKQSGLNVPEEMESTSVMSETNDKSAAQANPITSDPQSSSSVAPPKIPIILYPYPVLGSSSENSQNLVHTPATSSMLTTGLNSSFVSAAINFAMKNVIPWAMPVTVSKSEDPKLSVVSSELLTTSTPMHMDCVKIPVAGNGQFPETPMPAPNVVATSVSAAITQNLTNPCAEATASAAVRHVPESSTSSTSSASVSTNCGTIPAAEKVLFPETTVSSPKDISTSTVLMQTSVDPSTETAASSAVSQVPDISTAFPNFKPCKKCNSILVCSCPGTSGVNTQNSGDAALNTCSGSCQGECTCNGMGEDKKNGTDPSVPDVKPQIFPFVPLNELDQLFDSLVEYNKITKAEQPEAITTRLFPYQLQAVHWMMVRENNGDLAPFWSQVNKSTWFNKGTKMSTDRKPHSPKGGILADDMGLGKTLTVITLIMANHLNGQPMFSRKSSAHKRAASTSGEGMDCKPEKMLRKDSNSGDGDGDGGGDVMMEDKESVKQITIKKKKDTADKKKSLPDSKTLKQPGFKFRQMYLSKFSSKSIKKEKCKDKKDVHTPQTQHTPINVDEDDVLVGPWLSAGGNKKDAKVNSRPQSDDDHAATLIVCPLSVLSNWTDQICSHVHPDVSLQVYMYYGPERLRDVKFLRQQDIVLTTYPTLTNDYSRNDSPLHKIRWLRVILDEGHTIRNPQTRLTKAMAELEAKRRWVLTGTPIQNRLDDLWSVVKFLRLEPFDDKSWWNSALATSVRRGCQLAVNRLQKLLKHISIRRLKSDEDEGKPLVKLPPRTVVIQEVELSDEERKLYDAMQNHGQLIIARYLQDGTVLKKYAHCFAILMRLRQLCLHPSLCAKDSESLQHAQNLLQGLDDSDDDDLDADHDTQRLINDLLVTLSSGVDEECSVCLDSLVEPVITRCAHVFCQQCIMDVITSETSAPNCPLCRAPVNENDLIKVPEKKKKKSTETEKPSEESGQSKTSSKLETLMKALCAIRDKDPSRKSLVVSQFTSFLDIVEDALKEQDFLFVRLDGRMTQEARARAIETFSDPSSSSPTVFLLSLTAGGVGLNLTAATRVFLLDPAWNPAVEEQCFDRSHRLGQTQEVIITKYIVTNSVEERMLSLQEKKRELMGQAFGMETQSQEDRRRQRVRDIKHLIGL